MKKSTRSAGRAKANENELPRGNRFYGETSAPAGLSIGAGAETSIPAEPGTRAIGGPIVRAIGGPIIRAIGGPILKAIGGAIVPVPTVRAAGEERDPSPETELRVLCIHGVGDHHSDLAWQSEWCQAVLSGIGRFASGLRVEFEFMMYADIVEKYAPNPAHIAEALWRLGSSGIIHGIGDLFRRSRGILDLPHQVRWTAGLVAQWAAREDFRAETRERLGTLLSEATTVKKPFQVVLAHSLGSLVAYDTFSIQPNLIQDRTFVSFGSQIGNPFVRSVFGGRIAGFEPARTWFHLFNKNDQVFTSPISLHSPNFVQVPAPFDVPNDFANHSATWYLRHDNVVERVWGEAAWQALAVPGTRAIGGPIVKRTEDINTRLTTTDTLFLDLKKRRTRKALLVGINDYPNPSDRLEGCVNDVFLMSSVLQELNPAYDPDEIRVVLDERATAAGILDRLHWLLDDAQPGDERIFYYSGHGAQIPAYGAFEEVDHLDECLVTHDFKWTQETCITDDSLFQLYSQLPYNVRFAAIFDCCHSGGLTRNGTGKPKGLTPPDDIRHRALQWDAEFQMWRPRKPFEENTNKADPKMIALAGRTGAKHRLGSAVPLRQQRMDGTKDATKERKNGESRPFMPLLIHACDEHEVAFEYRHGAIAYGAFTFSLAVELRASNGKLKFAGLVERVTKRLHDMEYQQNPCLRGPTDAKASIIPWVPRKRGATRVGSPTRS